MGILAPYGSSAAPARRRGTCTRLWAAVTRAWAARARDDARADARGWCGRGLLRTTVGSIRINALPVTTCGRENMSYDFDNTVREWSYTMQKLNQQDLDRNFSLATTHLVKWMQAVRARLFWGELQEVTCPFSAS